MMQNAYDDQRLGRTRCYDWFKRFKDGRESVDDDPRSGRPSTSTGSCDKIQRCALLDL